MADETRNIDFKIQIPVLVPSYVTRERLSEKYSEKKVTVFHAGAGFGKTMLMADMVRSRGIQCVWYQLSSSDNDPVLFFEVLRVALERALPGLEIELRNRKPATIVEELAKALSQEPVKQVLIVFDDFQEILSEEIYELLATLISLTPEQVQYLFATKGGFPPFLAAFLAREQAVLVGQEELKFTFAETEEYLEKMLGEKLEPDLLKRLYDYAEGWPAGIRFASMGLKRRGNEMDLTSMLRGSRIYDYIAYEVFRKLPFELQQFLVDTSVLEPLTPALCDYVTGRMDGRNNLAYLAHENLFVYRLTGEKLWYRYHSIFKDFLISRLTEDRKQKICRKAAAYYIRRREFEQGVYYAILGLDYSTVKLGIELYGDQLIKEGRQALLNQWIEVLKDSKEEEQSFPFSQGRQREQPMPRLDVCCFGALKVWSEDGKTVIWRTKKTKELFACLFAEQGKTVDKEYLMELLWPERELQKSSALFDTTASYLRKALVTVDCGHAFVAENKKYGLKLSAIRSDYSKFLEITGQIAEGQFELPLPEGAKALAALYQEGYLWGEDYPWALTERERLEQRYIDSMFLLTDHYMEHEDWRLAVETAELALQTDPFSEELVGMLLDSLVRAGDRGRAKKQYDRLNTLWLKEMGQELYYDGFL